MRGFASISALSRHFPRSHYVLARVAKSIPVFLAIAVCNFILLKLAPGDAADVLAGEAGSATPEYLAALKSQFGLDQPTWAQLAHYVGRLLRLDLGWSFRNNQGVLALILERLPATLLLMIGALGLAFILGAALGVLASRHVNGALDNLISVVALLFYATPLFLVGLGLIIVFAVHLGWLPTGGLTTVGASYTGLRFAVDVALHLAMPLVTLALFFLALYARLMRASMLEVFNQDYVTTARAKGLSEGRITVRHVLRNAMMPMVTMLGLQVGTLLGGSVVVETVFAWPGIGRLAFEAVMSRDLNLLLGILLICSVVVIMANILVDLAYAWLDPRIELAR
ncbi:ABC transporter permease [Methylobacterium aquaticum]|uniref:ABC transporter permease n=1 Tax=Methylobacterium aquaticum TaxID=270351 RepID=A0A0J6SRU3_9HYPH|nr:ABC transporter permease [Methylobacterium aquaticum]KMO36307.1 ABC transporter permease [Methylobacterium aquaticum]